ncbi:MAG: hypothetical protein LUE22_01580 [Oscillospiraceae bacterium]|nr:hypothetical protein [Oscillospiraceae bacterium]
MTTSEMIKKVMEIVEEGDYSVYWVRTCNKDYRVGDICDNSYVWDDGDWTDEELNGVCCTGLPMFPEESDVKKCLKYHIRDKEMFGFQNCYYPGSHTYLIGGHSVEYGTDSGEYIIPNGTVICVLK